MHTADSIIIIIVFGLFWGMIAYFARHFVYFFKRSFRKFGSPEERRRVEVAERQLFDLSNEIMKLYKDIQNSKVRDENSLAIIESKIHRLSECFADSEKKLSE